MMSGGNSNYGKIATVVTAYFIISITMVFANKVLLSSKDLNIPAPLFVTWYQCVITVIICYLLGEYGSSVKSKDSWFKQFLPAEYNLTTALKVMPLSVVFVGMIVFNNLCLKYVEVSFYNVARSLTIVYNVAFTYLLLGESTSMRVMGCLTVVIAGFFIGSEGEVNFSLKGTIFGVLSSCFVSLNSIFTKKALVHVDNNEGRLTLYNNMNAMFLFLPLMWMMSEHQTVGDHWHLITNGTYWTVMTFAGIMGFAIGFVTVMQIQATSALTHNISGTAKACVQTILALMIWQNETTFNSILGTFMVIGGSMLYAYVRILDTEASKRRAAAAALELARTEAVVVKDGEQSSK